MPIFLWTQKQDIGPQGRAGHAAAYDAARDRTVLFGGIAGGAVVGDTWEWNGDLWTQRQDTGPSARDGSASGYDASRQQTILFGGEAGGVLLGDTWSWDGNDWTQVADTGPAARTGHSAVYDPTRERIVLFGGASSPGPMGDTWEWDGELWTQLQDVGPSPRANHCMAFDPTSGRTLLFGGAGAGGAGLDDTWAWDGSGWTQVADTGPTSRAGAAMVGATGAVILFGGIDSMDPSPGAAHSVLGDTWSWDGTAWTQVQDIGPSARWRHAMTFEGARGRLQLFGGLAVFALPGDPSMAAGLLGDTWVQETEVVAGPPGEAVVVSDVYLGAGSLDVEGASVVVTFTLSAPAPPGGVNVQTVAAYLVGDTYQLVPPDVLSLPGSVPVGPGEPGGSFAVVRGVAPAEPTEYIVTAAVEGTSFEHLAILPVS